MHLVQNETKVLQEEQELHAKPNLAVCAETDLGFI